MERISGPYKGYYIAAYTVANGHHHVGYAKICAVEPDNVWSVPTVEKLASAPGCHSEQEALLAAEKKARQTIAEIVGDPVTAPGALH